MNPPTPYQPHGHPTERYPSYQRDRSRHGTGQCRRRRPGGVSWLCATRALTYAATLALVAVAVVLVVAVVYAPGPAYASDAVQVVAKAKTLEQVITNLRNVIVGLLVALATLFLTIGGLRYILAGGDPGEVEAAKKTLKYAAVGYAVAMLAPLLVSILNKIVGA
jgi:hypothetical protein